jgi:hypothetical protein
MSRLLSPNRTRLVDPCGGRRNLLPAAKSLHSLERILVAINISQNVFFVMQ